MLKTPEKLADAISHMEAVTSRTNLHPPMQKDRIKYFTIAGTHISIALRLFAAGQKSGLTGQVFKVPSDDIELQNEVNLGHMYWILDESISASEAQLVSEWRNADQNQNQLNSEVQTLRSIHAILVKKLAEKQGGRVTLAELISSVSQQSLVT